MQLVKIQLIKEVRKNKTKKKSDILRYAKLH